MKKGTISLIIVLSCALVITLAVGYVKTSANKDVNNWLCGTQTAWGMAKNTHIHISDWDGNEYTCK